MAMIAVSLEPTQSSSRVPLPVLAQDSASRFEVAPRSGPFLGAVKLEGRLLVVLYQGAKG
jgi:hypothetical protein